MNNYCVAETETGQCGAKVENRDLGLCATCNKARVKAERSAPVPRTAKPMQRVGIIGHRSALAPISAKMKVALSEKKKAYAVVDAGPRICCSCGGTDNLTHSHVLTVGRFPQHRANPANILLECMECHTVWEHDKSAAKRVHASWAQKMAIMEMLEPAEFVRFRAWNPHLF